MVGSPDSITREQQCLFRHSTLTDMTAEELLAEMVLPEVSEYRAERLRERIVEMHRPSPWRSPAATATAASRWKTSSRPRTSA